VEISVNTSAGMSVALPIAFSVAPSISSQFSYLVN
jgi:hypothetical protein